MTPRELEFIQELNSINPKIASLEYSMWIYNEQKEALEERKKQDIDEQIEE